MAFGSSWNFGGQRSLARLAEARTGASPQRAAQSREVAEEALRPSLQVWTMSSSTRGFVPFGPRVQRRTVIRRFDVLWRLGGGGEGGGQPRSGCHARGARGRWPLGEQADSGAGLIRTCHVASQPRSRPILSPRRGRRTSAFGAKLSCCLPGSAGDIFSSPHPCRRQTAFTHSRFHALCALWPKGGSSHGSPVVQSASAPGWENVSGQNLLLQTPLTIRPGWTELAMHH